MEDGGRERDRSRATGRKRHRGRQAGRERKTERRCSLMLHECRVIEEVLIKQFE